jgi:hypothetical protein
MITHERSRPSWRRLRPAAALALAGLAAIGFAAAGCGDDDAGAGLTGPDGAAAGELSLDIPALAELDARLNLSETQRSEMAQVLADWRNDVADRAAKHAERRAARKGHDDGDFRTRGDGHRGHRGQFMGRFGGHHGFGDGLAADAPGFDHLADAAAILDNDQLATFATYIEERRADRHATRAGTGDGKFRLDGPMARKMASHLGLSESEARELRAAHKESGAAMRKLHQEYAAGTISAEQLRDGLRDIRLAMEARARTAMGDEEFEAFHERRSDRREKAMERRAERLDELLTKQADRLGRALRLDDAGKARVEAALQQTLPARRQLLDERSGGHLAPEEALYRGIQIEKEASAAIRATLTPDAAVRFDTLRRLIPGATRLHGRG